ncbi:hypothetical protein [Streptomyces lavendulae]|uniref:hypothetical protein n=1 Tax=Streptomyces lavendulae TaxID=1914 RepID=UPI0033E5CF0C
MGNGNQDIDPQALADLLDKAKLRVDEAVEHLRSGGALSASRLADGDGGGDGTPNCGCINTSCHPAEMEQ